MYREIVLAASFLIPIGLAQAEQVFSCAGAEVRIEVVKTGEYSVVSVVTARKGDESTVFRYTDIDYIGGICTESAVGKELILYQAHCGGSGCKDLDNWGIIDPEDLRALLVPSDSNRSKATAILGQEPPRINHKLSIEREKADLGVKPI